MGRYRVRLANVHLMIKNAYILQSFLKAGKEEYISGETLAKEHKISRVAINGRIRKLEETGLHFEAAPRRGYRLQEDPSELHTDLLQAHLLIKQPKAINPASVHLLDAVDSTNLEVERRLGSGADAPLAVIAKSQTQGRGRMGRSWHSEALRQPVPKRRLPPSSTRSRSLKLFSLGRNPLGSSPSPIF